MGGTEYAGQSTSGNAANPGSGFTIFEISKTDQSALSTQMKKHFIKTFSGYFMKSGLSLLSPLVRKLDASLAFEEALFIVAIGNGLKGMMSLKPYCSGSTASTCGGASNGTWSKKYFGEFKR
jgi:hypothetical protein